MLCGHIRVSYIDRLIFYIIVDIPSWFLNNCKSIFFPPWKLFFIILLNLILILPSTFWTVANLCTCGKKPPRTAPCRTGQLRAAPWAPVASKSTRSRSSSAGGVGKWHPQGPGGGWSYSNGVEKQHVEIKKRGGEASSFDSLNITIRRNFLASYFPYKHTPLDKVNGSLTATQKGLISSIDVTDSVF